MTPEPAPCVSWNWPHIFCAVPDTTISTTASSFFLMISPTVISLPVASLRSSCESLESSLSVLPDETLSIMDPATKAPSMELTIMVSIMHAMRAPLVTYFFSFFALCEGYSGAA